MHSFEHRLSEIKEMILSLKEANIVLLTENNKLKSELQQLKEEKEVVNNDLKSSQSFENQDVINIKAELNQYIHLVDECCELLNKG